MEQAFSSSTAQRCANKLCGREIAPGDSMFTTRQYGSLVYFCGPCSARIDAFDPMSDVKPLCQSCADLRAQLSALYERARIGELVESLMAGDRDLVAVGCARIIAKDAVIFSAKRHTYLGVDVHEDGDTLLAALEQLAEKVRGA